MDPYKEVAPSDSWKSLDFKEDTNRDSLVLRKSRWGRRRHFLLPPISFSMIHSGKCKNKEREQWKRGKQKGWWWGGRLVRGEWGSRKRKVILLCAEQPPPFRHRRGWVGAVSCVSQGSAGLLSQSADQRPSVVFVSNAVFWTLSQATQSKPLWDSGLCFVTSFPWGSNAPQSWGTTGFSEREKLGWLLLRQSESNFSPC